MGWLHRWVVCVPSLMYSCDLQVINQTEHVYTYVVKARGQRGQGDYCHRNSQSQLHPRRRLKGWPATHTHFLKLTLTQFQPEPWNQALTPISPLGCEDQQEGPHFHSEIHLLFLHPHIHTIIGKRCQAKCYFEPWLCSKIITECEHLTLFMVYYRAAEIILNYSISHSFNYWPIEIILGPKN